MPALKLWFFILIEYFMQSFCSSQVESLTAARKSAMQGQEPSDAIRVVNALLTQIDHIKRYLNK